MELTWINKLRIARSPLWALSSSGCLAWPFAAPADPLSPRAGVEHRSLGTMTLLVLAFGLGFAGYFIAWPHGREIGILAVPFGLAVWAGRSGPMRVLTQASNQPAEREALASSLRFEPLYWLLIVAAGFAGVLLAQRLAGESATKARTSRRKKGPAKGPSQVPSFLPAAFAVVGAVLLGHFLVGVFAQNVTASHTRRPPSPQIGQIIFAVSAAFAVVAFLVKKFTDLSYIRPAVGFAFGDWALRIWSTATPSSCGSSRRHGPPPSSRRAP